MLSWLHNNNIIFPSIDVIERMLAEAATLADRMVFSALIAPLEKQHKIVLDSLLISDGEQPSRLAWLLQPPGKINGKNVLQHIDRLNAIAELALPEGIALSVHQNRLLKLAREGRKMSSRDLSKFSDIWRYATLVCIGEFPASNERQGCEGNPAGSTGLGFESQNPVVAGSHGTLDQSHVTRLD